MPFCFYPAILDLSSQSRMLIANVAERKCDMVGSEGEALDAVRQPVVSLSVKGLPARGKQRASRQRFYSTAPPDEAVRWCDVSCAPGVKNATLCLLCYNGAAKELRRFVKYVVPPTCFKLFLYFTRKRSSRCKHLLATHFAHTHTHADTHAHK